MVLLLGISCQDIEDAAKKPAVVDWEKNNYGIRKASSGRQEDLLNTVNIDTNAPQLPKRIKAPKHNQRRKLTRPTITRNNLKVRSRSRGRSDIHSESEKFKADLSRDKIISSNKNNPQVVRIGLMNHSTYKTKSKDLKRDGLGSTDVHKSKSINHKREGLRSSRLRFRMNLRPAITESVLKVNMIEDNVSSSVKPNTASYERNSWEKSESGTEKTTFPTKKGTTTKVGIFV